MPFLTQTKGQVTSRDLVVTAGITLGIAAVMIALFVILNRQDDRGREGGETGDLIEQIRERASSEQDAELQEAPAEGAEPGAEEAFQPRATYTGTLSNHEPKTSITLSTANGEETILLRASTVITINGQTAAETDLSIGDTVRVEVERSRSGTQTALAVAILRSTSPTVPTNVSTPSVQPTPVQTRPVSPY